ncbi:hypothetical protein F511_44737 [Dorcoceras hygrometricum]|uniref:Uncharacterized protein n=1 Tax=Dorcoceras hygrometricum TaxID=472368 RepID=A0A2Z7BD66_9LAMI|nr:hypothetical protein F511_44737 [Dorcoceras hygrometricum]
MLDVIMDMMAIITLRFGTSSEGIVSNALRLENQQVEAMLTLTKESCFQSWTGLGDLPPPTLKCQFPCESGRSQAPRRQKEQLPVPKRPSQKRKRRLVLGSEDEFLISEAAVGGTSIEQEPTVEHVFEEQQIDNVDDIIQQTLTETAQVETD